MDNNYNTKTNICWTHRSNRDFMFPRQTMWLCRGVNSNHWFIVPFAVGRLNCRKTQPRPQGAFPSKAREKCPGDEVVGKLNCKHMAEDSNSGLPRTKSSCRSGWDLIELKAVELQAQWSNRSDKLSPLKPSKSFKAHSYQREHRKGKLV